MRQVVVENGSQFLTAFLEASCSPVVKNAEIESGTRSIVVGLTKGADVVDVVETLNIVVEQM